MQYHISGEIKKEPNCFVTFHRKLHYHLATDFGSMSRNCSIILGPKKVWVLLHWNCAIIFTPCSVGTNVVKMWLIALIEGIITCLFQHHKIHLIGSVSENFLLQLKIWNKEFFDIFFSVIYIELNTKISRTICNIRRLR